MNTKMNRTVESEFPTLVSVAKIYNFNVGDLTKLYERFLWANDLLPKAIRPTKEDFCHYFGDYMTMPKGKGKTPYSYCWMLRNIARICCWNGLREHRS